MPSFEQVYPHIAEWVRTGGWIEVGSDGISRSWARALDEGGLIWEGGDPSQMLDDVLHEMDEVLGRWLGEQMDG